MTGNRLGALMSHVSPSCTPSTSSGSPSCRLPCAGSPSSRRRLFPCCSTPTQLGGRRGWRRAGGHGAQCSGDKSVYWHLTSQRHWQTMVGQSDNDSASDTPFPSFPHESSLGMQHICGQLRLNRRLLIPRQVLRDVASAWVLFSGIKARAPGVMWPLTLDLSVRKLIMHRCCAISAASSSALSLFWGGDPRVERRRSLTSARPTQLNTHQRSLGIIKEVPLTESFSPRRDHHSFPKRSSSKIMSARNKMIRMQTAAAPKKHNCLNLPTWYGHSFFSSSRQTCVYFRTAGQPAVQPTCHRLSNSTIYISLNK